MECVYMDMCVGRLGGGSNGWVKDYTGEYMRDDDGGCMYLRTGRSCGVMCERKLPR